MNLHVIQASKFKTVKIMLRFREELNQAHLGKRVLISNMLETTNQIYQTDRDFSRALSEMYGASFTTGVAKKGKLHLLSINMSVVNPNYVNFDTVGSAIEMIKNALFLPDADGTQFNPEIFKREQTNLVHYLEAMNDDRSYFASRKLADLFFTNSEQALPSIATLDLLKEETATSVYAYYKEMLATNIIDIFVMGDVDEEKVVKAFEAFPFERRTDNADVIYHQPISTRPVEVIEHKDVAQSLLQLGFHLPVIYGDQNYLSLQVMNGILGGFSHSKLFANVREKESLAYSISSTFDSFTGFLKIAAGIDAKHFPEAKKLIFEQLESIKKGQFSVQDIEQTKTMLRNTYFIGQDSIANNIELEFVKALLPERFMDTETFLNELDKVNKESIMKVAQGLTYQAQYFMEGSSLQFEEE
ncbi:hypothetical protein RT41_GL001119 [Lactococcus fujiensis JCM 16395]|uniref:Peptidase M16 C-terminal domain-containing protein n=1 Tax=Lactococcus fujiensis JCM 16395 TaxID=1291764 RepID=A0A2A5RN29_9LACT|nr:hypothetical protein RT41_GL001119 [Lactococcus fujiensis JCM 16395]